MQSAQIQSSALIKKNGTPVYTVNPSVPDKSEIMKGRRTQLGDARQGIVIDEGTGEFLGRGGAIA